MRQTANFHKAELLLPNAKLHYIDLCGYVYDRRTYSNFGDRCFATVGPKLWNSLPDGLRRTDSLNGCWRLFLFGRWDRGALWLFGWNCMRLSKFSYLRLLTYLLTVLVESIPVRCSTSSVAAGAEGAERPGRKSGGAAKIGVITAKNWGAWWYCLKKVVQIRNPKTEN